MSNRQFNRVTVTNGRCSTREVGWQILEEEIGVPLSLSALALFLLLVGQHADGLAVDGRVVELADGGRGVVDVVELHVAEAAGAAVAVDLENDSAIPISRDVADAHMRFSTIESRWSRNAMAGSGCASFPRSSGVLLIQAIRSRSPVVQVHVSPS